MENGSTVARDCGWEYKISAKVIRELLGLKVMLFVLVVKAVTYLCTFVTTQDYIFTIGEF